MKTRMLTMLLAAATMLAACNTGADRTRDFIPGTYTDHAEGEYSVAYDTLIIQPLDGKTATYRIYRKTGYRRIESGRLLPPERKTEEWTAVYNPETKSMQETRRGRTITIYPDAGRILVERREYVKLRTK
ncbi:hypothetical protein [Parapedobacter sp. DT-150]|uniref:hypothetical protein n=1 Tax=Parapedobacter sp. DT-150 TaxID=3396162 RepID=UPI003F1B9AB5